MEGGGAGSPHPCPPHKSLRLLCLVAPGRTSPYGVGAGVFEVGLGIVPAPARVLSADRKAIRDTILPFLIPEAHNRLHDSRGGWSSSNCDQSVIPGIRKGRWNDKVRGLRVSDTRKESVCTLRDSSRQPEY